jgi:hypothetical protein
VRLALAIICILLAGCGDSDPVHDATGDPRVRIVAYTTVDEALAARHEGSIDILFEAALIRIPAVSERLARLRHRLDEARRNSSVCLSSGPALLGKAGAVCNVYDYDVLFLLRKIDQPISTNLAWYEEFAQEPLRAGLVVAMEALHQAEINEASGVCARMVFRDSVSEQIRVDIPIIVVIDPNEMRDQDIGVEKLLRRCLE